MLRHIVFFKWKASFTQEVREQWIDGLDAMIGNIPGMIRLVHGPDVLSTDKSWDHAIIADFVSDEDLQTYNSHPLHEAIKPYSLPNVEEIAYVDMYLDDPVSPEHQ